MTVTEHDADEDEDDAAEAKWEEAKRSKDMKVTVAGANDRVVNLKAAFQRLPLYKKYIAKEKDSAERRTLRHELEKTPEYESWVQARAV